MESGDPFGVLDVGLSAWNVFKMGRVPEGDDKTQGLPDIPDRLPVDTGGFHRDMLHAQIQEFLSCSDEIVGECFAFELVLDRLTVLLDQNGDGQFFLADINTGDA